MNTEDVKVSFYLKKSEANESGECPVMARLTVGKYSETAFSAKMLVSVSLWSSGRAMGKSARTREINQQLDEIRATALSIYREQSAVREKVTAEEVKSRLLGVASEQATLRSYFRSFNENFDKRVGANREQATADSYWYALNHLTRFLKEKYNLSDIPFTALDESFIRKYDLHLRLDCHLAPGTIILLTTRLGTIIREAVSDGVITANPFAGYEPKRPASRQKYLTGEELERIMNTPLPKQKLYHVRDLFLFSCYTGIPYGDMCRLTKEDLEVAEDGELWIKTSRKKTQIAYEVPLLDVPLYILEKYRDIAPEGQLLPMYTNSELNSQLKKIAELCGIERRLVFHAGRHTYATEITLSQGVPLETVSKMLGHSRISTTQIYAKVTDEKIDTDTRNLDTKISERFSIAI
ncbi:site-specific integrase [Bacteroides uniformis]|uniref:site-specific integrase n=1 Tax=Bacteroides uniformis TaxID=820 RepID=UPI0039B6E7DF